MAHHSELVSIQSPQHSVGCSTNSGSTGSYNKETTRELSQQGKDGMTGITLLTKSYRRK